MTFPTKPRRASVCLLAGFALLPLLAGSAFAGSLVKISTPVGSVTLELFDQQRPITVQNFLSYIKTGRYENSFSHRLLTNFVIQGGGFAMNGNSVDPVPTFAAIKNEYNGAPGFSNLKGTITMAKVDGNPNSATSQWFINLKNNNTGLPANGNLDLQNGGFTVFGKVVSGLTTLDTINNDFSDANTNDRAVFNLTGPTFFNNGNFHDCPLISAAFDPAYFFYTSFEILYEEPPTLKTAAKVRVRKAFAKLKGKVSAGVDTIQWHVGPKGKVHQQKANKVAWELKATGLERGENIVYVRAITTSGGIGAYKKIKVIRK